MLGIAERALAQAKADVLVIDAGRTQEYDADDIEVPFHANANFLRFVPHPDSVGAFLVFRTGAPKFETYWVTSNDYWLEPVQIPEWVESRFEVKRFASRADLEKTLEQDLKRHQQLALISTDYQEVASRFEAVNKKASLAAQQLLDYERMYKTEFEQRCMERATLRAVIGHKRAKRVFRSGGSEFEILWGYLLGSLQAAHETPYPSIVAGGRHASVMHYQKYDPISRNLPSLLIDAGGHHCAYDSDITRTYCRSPDGIFHDLIKRVDVLQQTLTAELQIGTDFTRIHERMLELSSELLVDVGIVKCSASEAFETELTDTFIPHGVGHAIGISTHDAGGHQVSPAGTLNSPSTRFSYLRLTRDIQPGMVFTIEPGIYFIDTLLKARSGDQRIDWDLVKQLRPFGGVRIEDNILVRENEFVNLTRRAFESGSAPD